MLWLAKRQTLYEKGKAKTILASQNAWASIYTLVGNNFMHKLVKPQTLHSNNTS